MTSILVIRSSASGAASATNQLIDELTAGWQEREPGARLVERDLDRAPVPHVVSSTLAGIGRPAPETPEALPTRALADRMIEELEAADVIVIGAPMYNFGIPSTLKAWFDHVLRAGRTFRYTDSGPEGLLNGRRAIIISARGGIYSQGPAEAMDNQEAHLHVLLGFMGVTDVEIVRAEGLAIGSEERKGAIDSARAALTAVLPPVAARAA